MHDCFYLIEVGPVQLVPEDFLYSRSFHFSLDQKHRPVRIYFFLRFCPYSFSFIASMSEAKQPVVCVL